MLLGGLYDKHKIYPFVIRELWLSQLCAIVDLLLYNSNGVIDLKTIEIDVPICVMTLIYFIENLPSYVPMYLLFLVFVLLICHVWNVLLLVVLINSTVLISLRVSVFDIKVLIVLTTDAIKLVVDGEIVILNQHLLISHGHFPASKRVVTVSLVHGFVDLHLLNLLLLLVALADELLGPECRYQAQGRLFWWRSFER